MRRRSIIPAVILILVGLWFLAANFGAQLPGWGQMWPIFPLGGGLLFLATYLFDRRDPGLVFVGLGAALVGAFFFLFTLQVPLPIVGMQRGVHWNEMARLWPAFVVIGGVAFLGLYLADPHHRWGTFTMAVLALIVGVVAFAFTLGWIMGDLGQQLARFWPVVLIVLGVIALLEAMAGSRPHPNR